MGRCGCSTVPTFWDALFRASLAPGDRAAADASLLSVTSTRTRIDRSLGLGNPPGLFSSTVVHTPGQPNMAVSIVLPLGWGWSSQPFPVSADGLTLGIGMAVRGSPPGKHHTCVFVFLLFFFSFSYYKLQPSVDERSSRPLKQWRW